MAMSESSEGVVCDAGPLIHLDEVENLFLLADFASILVPEQVWQEVKQHRPAVLTRPPLPLQKIAVTVSTQPSFQTLAQALVVGDGRASSLVFDARLPAGYFSY